MPRLLPLILFVLARCCFADGYLLFSNEFSDYRAPLPGADQNFRAVLFLFVGANGALSPLEPPTNFRSTAPYLNPVTVRVPGKSPGDTVTVLMRAYDGDEIYSEGIVITVRLGTKSDPGSLYGMQTGGISFGFRGFWQSLYPPIYIDPFFVPNPNDAFISLQEVTGLLVDRAEKIIVAGNYPSYAYPFHARVVRLTRNGSIDQSFKTILAPASQITQAKLDPNEKIILAGYFPTDDGTADRLIRLLPNGARDLSFASSITQQVTQLMIEQTGSMLVGTTISNKATLYRLTSSGTVDADFAVNEFGNAGAFTAIHGIAQPETNSYWIGGDFSSVNGEATGSLVRLDRNGGLLRNPDFPLVLGRVVALVSNLFGGDQLTINGTNGGTLARIVGTNVLWDQQALYYVTLNTNQRFFPEITQIQESGAGPVIYTKQFVSGGPAVVFAQRPFPSLNGRIDQVVMQSTNLIVAGTFSTWPTIGPSTDSPGLLHGLARLTPYPIIASNPINRIKIYDDFLLLFPKWGWNFEFQYSSDLKNWVTNPNGIRDTNLTEKARFYRVKPQAPQ